MFGDTCDKSVLNKLQNEFKKCLVKKQKYRNTDYSFWKVTEWIKEPKLQTPQIKEENVSTGKK